MNFGLLLAATSALSSPSDYIFAPFVDTNAAAYWIDGRIMGSGADYRYVRAEDVAWICEGWAERNCLNVGSFPSVPYFNIVTNRVIQKAEFPAQYGRWPIMPGYVRMSSNLTFQTGLYMIESGAAVAERVAKMDGGWCVLTNVYWRANYSNRLERALTREKILNNFELLALAGTLEKENLSRVDRSQGGRKRRWYEYQSWSQIPGEGGWNSVKTPMTVTTNAWSGSEEYVSTVSGEKTAIVGSVRESSSPSGWMYFLSPPRTVYSLDDSVQTGACCRVCFTLNTASSLVTTGGVTRFQSVDLFVPLSVDYHRLRYTFDENGGRTESTNITQRFVYVMDATLDLTGVTAKAYADLNGEEVATAALQSLGVPAPAAFALSELANAHMYGDDTSGYYASSDQEDRRVSLTVSGNAVAIIGCTFKTSPP